MKPWRRPRASLLLLPHRARPCLEELENRCLPSVNASFPAFDFSDGGEPGPSVAAGPANLLAIQDGGVGLFARDGTLLQVSGLTAPLQSNAGFFERVDQDNPGFSPGFDAYAIYDAYAQVVITAAIQVSSNNAFVLLGVSTSSSPDDLDVAPDDTDQDWHFYTIPATQVFNGTLCKIDNPRLAVDADTLYISGSYRTFGGFTYKGEQVIRLDKGPLLQGTLGAWNGVIAAGASRLRPAENTDRTLGDPQLFVEALGDKTGLRVWEMDDAGALTAVATLSAPFTDFKNGAPQPDTTAVLGTGSPFLPSAVWRDNSLWTAHVVKRATGEATVRWYEIDTTGGNYAIVQQGDINPGPGIHTYVPAIAVNAAGDMAITYTQSSSSQYATMMIAGRKADYAPGFLDQGAVAKAGQGAFGILPGTNHWGSHVSMTVDAIDGLTFWAMNETPTSDPSKFATWLASYTVAPSDIILTAAAADGGAGVTLTYTIVGEVAPFEVGWYRSTDAAFGAGDELLTTVFLDAPEDLTPGVHTKTFAIGTGLGEILLPGVGVAETDGEYHLLVVADHLAALPEHDANSFTEDNVVLLQGAYHAAGGDVFVHARLGADVITLSEGTSADLTLSVNGAAISYAVADVSAVRVRSHAGADQISAAGVATPLLAWGGADADTLTGGDGNDVLAGGLGNDTVAGGAGADIWIVEGTSATETITVSPDSVAGRLKAVRSSETDLFTFDGQDLILVTGDAGNDTLTVTATVTVSARLEGGLGNDTLNGGAGADLLLGGDGNDTLSGKAANDVLDGGLGDDTVIFAATAAIDFLDVSWDAATSQLAIARRAAAGATPTELDRASAVERLTVQGLAGNDTIDLSALGATEIALAGLTGTLLDGGPGNDTIIGSAAADTLQGGAGNDLLDGGAGADEWLFTGTAGNDFLDATWDAAVGQLVAARRAAAGATPTELDRASAVERLTVQGLAGNDTIDLSALGATEITLAGLAGTLLDGGAGNDTIIGSAAADTLQGGAGNDVLDGRAGADVWLISGTSAGDAIDVSLVEANRLSALRRNVGGSTVLEADDLIFDGEDAVQILALGGNDTIQVAAEVPIIGIIDGGAGTDTATSPASWTKINCEK